MIESAQLSDKPLALDLVEAFIELYAEWGKSDPTIDMTVKSRRWVEEKNQIVQLL